MTLMVGNVGGHFLDRGTSWRSWAIYLKMSSIQVAHYEKAE